MSERLSKDELTAKAYNTPHTWEATISLLGEKGGYLDLKPALQVWAETQGIKLERFRRLSATSDQYPSGNPVSELYQATFINGNSTKKITVLRESNVSAVLLGRSVKNHTS
jgi:hypothetical protein